MLGLGSVLSIYSVFNKYMVMLLLVLAQRSCITVRRGRASAPLLLPLLNDETSILLLLLLLLLLPPALLPSRIETDWRAPKICEHFLIHIDGERFPSYISM